MTSITNNSNSHVEYLQRLVLTLPTPSCNNAADYRCPLDNPDATRQQFRTLQDNSFPLITNEKSSPRF